VTTAAPVLSLPRETTWNKWACELPVAACYTLQALS
jgi:hypothetical protein